jgi:hypothetical protein
MRFFFSLTAAIFCSLFVAAQNSAINMGAETSCNKVNLLRYYPTCNGGYVCKPIGIKYKLFRIDKNGRELDSAFLERKGKKFRDGYTVLQDIYMMSGKMFAVYLCKGNRDKELLVVAAQFDSVSLALSDSFTVIAALPPAVTRIGIGLSENNTKMVIHSFYTQWNKPAKTWEWINNVTVVDHELKTLYSKAVFLPPGPYSTYVFRDKNICVDDMGNVAIIAYTDSFNLDLPPHIFLFSKTGEATSEIIPALSGKRLHKARPRFAADGSFVLAGNYSENGGYCGTWFYSPRKNDGAIVYNEFTPEFIAENGSAKYLEWLKEKHSKGKMPGIPDLYITDMKISESGMIYLFSEQVFDRNYTFYTYNSSPDATWGNLIGQGQLNFNYDKYANIVVTKMNPEGKAEWNNWILKKQDELTLEISHCSFASTVHDDNVKVLFNDHPANLLPGADLKFNSQEPNAKKGEIVPVVVEINEAGQQTRKRLPGSEALGEYFLMISFAGKGCGNNLSLIARDYGKNKYKLVSIDL